MTVHASGGIGLVGGGTGSGAAWLDGVSGVELAVELAVVVAGVETTVAGNGVLDTVESPELHPASAAAKTATETVSRFHTSQHGTRPGGRRTGCHAHRH